MFSDNYGLLTDDPDYSGEEDRFLLLGLSANLRTLVVAHCNVSAKLFFPAIFPLVALCSSGFPIRL